MRYISARSWGYGARFGTIRTVRQAELAEAKWARGALVFTFVPDVQTFLQTVVAVDPVFCVVPPCSAYSHLAAAIWANDVPTLSVDEPWCLSDETMALADFDNEMLVLAESEAEAHELTGRARVDDPTPGGDTSSAMQILVEPSSARDVYDPLNASDGLSVIRAEQLFLDTTLVNEPFITALRARQLGVTTYVRFFDPDQSIASPLQRGPFPQPALGHRGIRILEVNRSWLDRFKMGLESLALDPVVAVVPMATAPRELDRFRQHLGPRWTRVGVTVETPAAAVRIADMLGIAEFVQIGLNDLTQYTMAWDRDIPNAERLPPNHLAQPVADLITSVAAACAAAKIPYTLGLDLKPNPALATQLMTLGVASISCARSLVGPWRRALATCSA